MLRSPSSQSFSPHSSSPFAAGHHSNPSHNNTNNHQRLQSTTSAQAFPASATTRGDGVSPSSWSIPPGNLMLQQGASGDLRPPVYTSASYNPSVPASQFAQQQYHQQQQQTDQRHSASPQPHASPRAALSGQPTPPRQFPMAAPPLPQTPTNPAGMNAAPSPSSPQSPGAQSREQQRINLLFEINVELLQEINKLQAEGQGGAISAQQLMQLRSEGKPDKMASEDYIQCLRRVQANLSYLMPKAQTDPSSQAKAPAGPAHMTPPPHMSQLLPKYEQLRDLFPAWSGMDRPAASSASPQMNGPSAMNGMPTPSTGAQA